MNTNKVLVIGTISVLAAIAGIFLYFYMKKDTSVVPLDNTKYVSPKSTDATSMSIKEIEALATKTGVEKAFSEIEKLLHINNGSYSSGNN